MNAIARTCAVVAIALVWWLSGAGVAAAHTALASSDPADGATVAAPSVVTLTFTEDINPAFATVVVNTGGANVVSGPVEVTGPRLRVGVTPGLPGGGDCTVAYRVVSADGHPVSGSFTFTVAPAAGGAVPSPSPVAAPTPAASSPSASEGPLGSDSKTSILVAGAAGLGIGCAIAYWQSRKHRRRDLPDDEEPTE